MVECFPGETSKARARRLRTGWFDRFIADPGIDIGCGNDPLNDTFDKWDTAQGDATTMEGVEDGKYQTVYASHVLEHLADPVVALQNWWRILRPGGHLIVVVPHRDLYEGRRELPSRWNADHKWFFLPDRCELPHTLSLKHTIYFSLPGRIECWPSVHSDPVEALPPFPRADGIDANSEYSIEAIVRKP